MDAFAKILDCISNEAIKNYSGKPHPLAKKLISICDDYIYERKVILGKKSSTTGLNKDYAEKIKKAIRQETNINVDKFVVAENEVNNAWTYIPDINSDNPLFKAFLRTGDDTTNDLLKETSKVEGWVDRNKVKVFGVFKDVKCNMGVTTGAATSPGAMAWSIAHELGHIWSAFEFVGHACYRNISLMAAAQDIKKDWNNVDKVELVKNLNKLKDAKEKDIKAEDIEDVKKFDVVVGGMIVENFKSYMELNESTYDDSGPEAYADQFAARLGLGSYAVKDLIEVNKDYINNGSLSLIMNSIFSVILDIVMISMPFYGLYLMFYSVLYVFAQIFIAGDGIYDKLEDRIARIKRELIAGLKQTTDPEQRKAILEELKIIEDSSKGITEKLPRGVISFAVKTLIPYLRNNANKKQLQQSYEQLINNDLYTRSHQFSGLA